MTINGISINVTTEQCLDGWIARATSPIAAFTSCATTETDAIRMATSAAVADYLDVADRRAKAAKLAVDRLSY